MADLTIRRVRWATGDEKFGSGIRARVLETGPEQGSGWQFYTDAGDIDQAHAEMLEALLPLLDNPAEQIRLDADGTLLLYGREYDWKDDQKERLDALLKDKKKKYTYLGAVKKVLSESEFHGNRATAEAAEEAALKRHEWWDRPPESETGERLTDPYAEASLDWLTGLFEVVGRIEGLEVEHDLWTVASPEKGLEDRMEAALRLATGVFRNPIHHLRWRAHEREIMRELGRRADSRGTWWKVELVAATQKALVEAGWKTEFCSDTEALIRDVRRELNRLVTLDLLGEDYDRERRFDFTDAEEADREAEEDRAITEAEIAEYLAHVVDDAKLSERDAELWLAVAWRGEAIADAAEALGIERGAADVALHRARKKIKKVLANL